MSRKALIKVVGSINVDFTTNTPRVPGPGETLLATALTVNAGGKGANQAVACGRASCTSKSGAQSVHVEMTGAVGATDPYYASLILPTLEGAGIDCSGINKIEDCQTGTASIIVDDGNHGENRIMVVSGANFEGMQDAEQIANRVVDGEHGDVIVMQGEIPKGTVFRVLDNAFKEGANASLTMFNPAPVFEGGIPDKYLGQVDILVVNESELLDLATHAVPESMSGLCDQDRASLSTNQISSIADKLHTVPVPVVIVTLGSRGVFYSFASGETGVVAAAQVSRVVDTTAAGDTFVGYLAVEVAKLRREAMSTRPDGRGDAKIMPPVQEVVAAIETANVAAAKCVQRKGAMQSIPWGYE